MINEKLQKMLEELDKMPSLKTEVSLAHLIKIVNHKNLGDYAGVRMAIGDEFTPIILIEKQKLRNFAKDINDKLGE